VRRQVCTVTVVGEGHSGGGDVKVGKGRWANMCLCSHG